MNSLNKIVGFTESLYGQREYKSSQSPVISAFTEIKHPQQLVIEGKAK